MNNDLIPADEYEDSLGVVVWFIGMALIGCIAFGSVVLLIYTMIVGEVF